LVLAQTCVFAKQSLEPIICGLPLPHERIAWLQKAILIPKLRNHFAEFLFQGSLERLRLLASPTCVGFSTGTPYAKDRRFSWWTRYRLRFRRSSHSLLGLRWRIYLPTSLKLSPALPIAGTTLCPRPACLQTRMEWYRNINRLSIDYAFRPRLRCRLTLGGITFPRKP
jgi:hypothetical protein